MRVVIQGRWQFAAPASKTRLAKREKPLCATGPEGPKCRAVSCADAEQYCDDMRLAFAEQLTLGQSKDARCAMEKLLKEILPSHLDHPFDIHFYIQQIDFFYNLEIDGETPGESSHSFVVNGIVASGLGDNDVLNKMFPRQDVWKEKV